MSDNVDALGALATAGLAASELDKPSVRRRVARDRAVREAQWWRRHPVEAADAHTDPKACANCATSLIGDFCHVCGQSGHVHRSVAHLFEEFAHGLYHFDSKAWRTLPLLTFHPGRLTRDYVYGRRARYIAPLALFLLSIFLMFFAFGYLVPRFDPGIMSGGKSDKVAEAKANLRDVKRDVVGAERELATEKLDTDNSPAQIARYAAAVKDSQAALATAQAALVKAEAAPATPDKRVVVAPGTSWQDALAERARSGEFKVDTGIPFVDDNIRKALKDPEFALFKIEQKAYKLSFLLVPLSLPTLWLLFFWRRGVKIYDHVIFSLYSLSFMSLLLVTATLLEQGANWFAPLATVASLLFFVPPVHLFAQLKGGYALGNWGALWRTVVLGIASIITLGMFLSMIVILGLAT